MENEVYFVLYRKKGFKFLQKFLIILFIQSFIHLFSFVTSLELN